MWHAGPWPCCRRFEWPFFGLLTSACEARVGCGDGVPRCVCGYLVWREGGDGGAVVDGERTPEHGAPVPGRAAGRDTGLLCVGIDAARLAAYLAHRACD